MGVSYSEHVRRCCVGTNEEKVIGLVYDVGHNHIGGCNYVVPSLYHFYMVCSIHELCRFFLGS